LAKGIEITVIGHPARDFFHTFDAAGTEQLVEAPGGIFYSIATLASILSTDDTIVPVFGIHEEEYNAVVERLHGFENVDPKGIFKTKERMNEVHFFSTPTSERKECSRHISSPIPFQRIKPHLDAHGILINMASGFDILLETLDNIRMTVRDDGIPIHFDVHSLVLGIDDDQTRFPRPLSDWRRWCFMLQSIQMTEEEAAGLTTERYDETTFINQLMPLMVNALIITRGDRGATLIRQEHKKLFRHDVPGVAVPAVIDTIGCGDVFGAAFFASFLRTKDYVKASEAATAAASVKSTFRGPDGLTVLRPQTTQNGSAAKAEG
jgi:hypothetical protein